MSENEERDDDEEYYEGVETKEGSEYCPPGCNLIIGEKAGETLNGTDGCDCFIVYPGFNF